MRGGGGLLETTGRPANLLASREGDPQPNPALPKPFLMPQTPLYKIYVSFTFFGLKRSFLLDIEPSVLQYKL